MAGITRMFDRQPRSLKGGEEAAAKIAQKRPEEETHLTKRFDRVKPYLVHRMKDFTFDEFSKEWLSQYDLKLDLEGVPIPLRKEDREAFKSPEGLKSMIIAENMARVIGIDPRFEYAETYVAFFERLFGQKGVDNLTRKAKDHAERGDHEDSCIYFRAALVVKFNDLPALYGYARILRQLYTDGKKESYIGTMKAECLDYFELTTEFYPRFDMGFYYLGYMYLNLGLYTKAKLAWDKYMENGRDFKDRKEIRKRIKQLEEPIKIENGYNAVLSGKWNKGLQILEPYKESKFNDWWPLWYYLGVAYARTGNTSEAEKSFKEALKGSPRHIESMEELADLYTKTGNKIGVKKYKDKLLLIKKQDQP
jgi:tetratricopeptide (TPR) repeat protein